MNTSQSFRMIFVLGLAALFVSACSTPAAPTVAPAVVPPSAVPLAPIATPLPATDTPIPPTNTSLPTATATAVATSTLVPTSAPTDTPTVAPTAVPPTNPPAPTVPTVPTVVPTTAPTLPPVSLNPCNLDPGNAGILVIDDFDGQLTFTVLNHEYKIPGHSRQIVQVPGGQMFTASVSVVGVGKTSFGPVNLNAGDCVKYEPHT